MVLAGYDTSNLVALYNDGVQCETCCEIGVPCTHCDVTTPLTVFVQIDGATDIFEGLCVCLDYAGGSKPSKFEGLAADDVLNNVIVECTQVSACRWVGSIILTGATLKTYGGASCPLGPPDCTGGLLEIREICSLRFEVERHAANTEVLVLVLGQDTPGSGNCGETWHSFGVFEFITCDGDQCVCCEKEGGLASGRFWDLTGATIRTWSALCATMHVNDVSASANAAGCAGDEEKIQVEVTIHDSADNPIDNVNVEITLTGAVSDIVHADTNGAGVATYLSDCLCINGTINVEVTNVTKGGFLWDPADDEDSLTDSILMDCV